MHLITIVFALDSKTCVKSYAQPNSTYFCYH